jgi:hypothetical protein
MLSQHHLLLLLLLLLACPVLQRVQQHRSLLVLLLPLLLWHPCCVSWHPLHPQQQLHLLWRLHPVPSHACYPQLLLPAQQLPEPSLLHLLLLPLLLLLFQWAPSYSQNSSLLLLPSYPSVQLQLMLQPQLRRLVPPPWP